MGRCPLGTWWVAHHGPGGQNECRRWGQGWREADLAHSPDSMLLALGRVPLGTASGYRLWLLPVRKPTAGPHEPQNPEGPASGTQNSPWTTIQWRNQSSSRYMGYPRAEVRKETSYPHTHLLLLLLSPRNHLFRVPASSQNREIIGRDLRAS